MYSNSSSKVCLTIHHITIRCLTYCRIVFDNVFQHDLVSYKTECAENGKDAKLITQYKKYTNKLTWLQKIAKQQYYFKLFQKYRSDSKKHRKLLMNCILQIKTSLLIGSVYFITKMLLATDRLELLCRQLNICSCGMMQYKEKGHIVRKTLSCSWCNRCYGCYANGW